MWVRSNMCCCVSKCCVWHYFLPLCCLDVCVFCWNLINSSIHSAVGGGTIFSRFIVTAPTDCSGQGGGMPRSGRTANRKWAANEQTSEHDVTNIANELLTSSYWPVCCNYEWVVVLNLLREGIEALAMSTSGFYRTFSHYYVIICV